MGIIEAFMAVLFGGARNVVRETTEVFRENAEAAAERGHDMQQAALAQFAAEFALPKQGIFDRIIDGMNRLPRPFLALGTLGLLTSAMLDPVWFAARMQGVALVPDPLWWLLGVIVTFYFGARHQAKGQAFQRNVVAELSRMPQVLDNLEILKAYGGPAEQRTNAARAPDDPNPALVSWHETRDRAG